MSEIVNKFLLAGDKIMPEMHLKEPGFTYSAWVSFTKKKERIQKFMLTVNTDYIYKNDLDKACFQHDMAYGKYKDLAKRTQSDKVLKDKAFQIASNPKYDGYQRGLASMVLRFWIKNPLHLQINLLKIVVLNLCKISVLWTWLRNNLQMNFINQ